MNFKKPEIADIPIFKEYFDQDYFTASSYTPAMLYMWAPVYDGEYAIVDDLLVFRCRISDEIPVCYCYPIGAGDKKAVIDQLIALAEEEGVPFFMNSITREIEKEMRGMYGDTFIVDYRRSESDYVYLSEKLISLSGKKLHGKRNHINRFNANHSWTYETITDENEAECFEMLKYWESDNTGLKEEETGKKAEISVANQALKYRKELGFRGGLIRCEGEVIAFSMGEPLNKDTFVVHFEKAFSKIQGAYPIINQQFVAHEASEYTYINREEDCGEEGLRHAKLSYKPVMLVEKGFLQFC